MVEINEVVRQTSTKRRPAHTFLALGCNRLKPSLSGCGGPSMPHRAMSRHNADDHEFLLCTWRTIAGLRTVPIHDGSTGGYCYGTVVYMVLDSSVRNFSILSDSSSAN